MRKWEDRSPIIANLLNPAFCGEVIRRTVISYNKHGNNYLFPYTLTPLILPILLHKETRDRLPKTPRTYFHKWVMDNDALLIGFASRVRNMLPFMNESISFLLHNNALNITDEGALDFSKYQVINPQEGNIEEITDIYKKAQFLGHWLINAGDVQTIYMLLKIKP